MNSPIDYYQVLECSPTASLETIHHLIRFQLNRHEQEATVGADQEVLNQLATAIQVFKTEQTRASYDQTISRSNPPNLEATSGSDKLPTISIEERNETEERYQVLLLLSKKRRKDLRNPGLPASSLATATKLPDEVIDFHLWYFMQKGWVQREESGVLSITAAGIDRIDEMNLARSISRAH